MKCVAVTVTKTLRSTSIVNSFFKRSQRIAKLSSGYCLTQLQSWCYGNVWQTVGGRTVHERGGKGPSLCVCGETLRQSSKQANVWLWCLHGADSAPTDWQNYGNSFQTLIQRSRISVLSIPRGVFATRPLITSCQSTGPTFQRGSPWRRASSLSLVFLLLLSLRFLVYWNLQSCFCS